MPDVVIARRYAPGSTTSDILDLPLQFAGSGVLMRPGEVLQPVYKTVPTAVELVRRMTPWCSLTLAPRLYARGFYAAKAPHKVSFDPTDLIEHKEEMWEAVGGYAVPSFNAIYASLQCGPRGLLEIIAHECWHQIEARLAPWMVELVDSHLDAAAATSYWDSEYHSRPQEIRARAFEAWVGRLLAGLPAPVFMRERGAPETLDEIFGMAWSGQLAEEFEAEQREAA